MKCVLRLGPEFANRYCVLVCWLPWRCAYHLTKMCLFSQFGACVFVRWYAREEFSVEFPNQENRMPVSMEEFGENSCMNERISGLKKNNQNIPLFSHLLQLTASLVNPRPLGLVVNQLL